MNSQLLQQKEVRITFRKLPFFPYALSVGIFIIMETISILILLDTVEIGKKYSKGSYGLADFYICLLLSVKT